MELFARPTKSHFVMYHKFLTSLFWINILTVMLNKLFVASLLLLVLAGVSSCGSGNPPASNSPGSSSAPAPSSAPLTGFAKDLDFVRKGQYTYVWVFSRKDGKPIDREDAEFLRTTAPQVVDRVITDNGTKVIVGTNFDLAQGNLELLKKRFVAEDYTGR